MLRSHPEKQKIPFREYRRYGNKCGRRYFHIGRHEGKGSVATIGIFAVWCKSCIQSVRNRRLFAQGDWANVGDFGRHIQVPTQLRQIQAAHVGRAILLLKTRLKMETKDTLLEAFKTAAENEQPVAFQGMEDVWKQIENKLDAKEEKKTIPIWTKWMAAASILVILGIGGSIWRNSKTQKIDIAVLPKIASTTNANLTTTIKDSARPVAEKTIVATTEKLHTIKKKHPFYRPRFIPNSIAKSPKTISDSISSSLAVNNFENNGDSAKNIVAKGIVQYEKSIAASPTIASIPKPSVAPDYAITNILQGRVAGVSANAVSEQNNRLEEVVVTGYGTKKKNAITGTVATVPSSTLNSPSQETTVTALGIKKTVRKIVANPPAYRYDNTNGYMAMNNKDGIAEIAQANSNTENLLQGKVSGLAISSDAGRPGNATQIRIRGNNSITPGQEPLYVVDGVIIDKTALNKIDPNNIKSINVLKDASATAIYSSRAANGAIIITTKNLINLPQSNIANESYETYKENNFASPISTPYSTFSIDVDNASYTNIRRFINNGQSVPKDAVRIEEMINFFKYHTPQPNGNNPYTINSEYGIAPWNPQHQILKISLQGKTIPEEKIPASNLVFLIDVSGSMNEPNKLPLLQASLKLLVGKLRAKDKVSIVTYAGNAGLVLPTTSGNDKQTIINAINNLSAGGSTAGGAGIELAYKIGKEQFIDGGNNRVILATDGDFNVGVSSEKGLEELISEKRENNIFLTCLGFGMGNYKDSKMQTLAQKGNGNYAYIDNIQEANRVLVKEFGGTMFTIAKDVKIQIEFNPNKVKAYRLIGYETRLLKDEDFANDKIDAGEMGSGHTVTALYEIIPSNIAHDSLFREVPAPRYVQPQNADLKEELAFIKTRYKQPTGDKSIELTIPVKAKVEANSHVSLDYKLATTVAWFGLKLRDSKLLPDKSTKSILEWGKSSTYDDPDGYISELFRLIETQYP